MSDRVNEAAERLRYVGATERATGAVDDQATPFQRGYDLGLHHGLSRTATGAVDVDEEDIIDRAVPSSARFGQVPRTEVIRSIVRAIHEQGARLSGESE